jgi:hypothetical protein
MRWPPRPPKATAEPPHYAHILGACGSADTTLGVAHGLLFPEGIMDPSFQAQPGHCEEGAGTARKATDV